MAKKANRLGVRKDQVDVYGRPIASAFYQALVQDLPAWTDLPVWKGGTEQLLPENDDEPETSPILCDIYYPDELREDQYFTYRQSPTTEDGLAKIRGIRGNTLVWNQLVTDGNFTDLTKWNKNGNVSLAISDNILTVTVTGDMDGNEFIECISRFTLPTGHKGLYSVYIKPSRTAYSRVSYASVASSTREVRCEADTWTNVKGIISSTNNARCMVYFNLGQRLELGDTVQIKMYSFNDITRCFGSTIADQIYAMETATAGSGVAYFKSLFPLDYYATDSGSLLSFTGTKLKTVGFNQWDEEWEVGQINPTDGQNKTGNNVRSKNYIRVVPSTKYYWCSPTNNALFLYDADKNYQNVIYVNSNSYFDIPSNIHYIRFYIGSAYGTTYHNDVCINIFDSSKNGTYEPYISNETDLPTSTFFPTGMKSAGTVYDELTPTRAITRVGAIDLGTLDWTAGSSNNFFYANLTGALNNTGIGNTPNLLCPSYVTTSAKTVTSWSTTTEDKVVSLGYDSARVYIRDSNYSDKDTFASAMSGIYLFYELATPVEQATMSFE